MKKKKTKTKLSGTVKMQFPPRTRVEIVRSFSFKLNVGNYESRDFFASQKAECDPKDADKVSEALYQWCKKEVLRSVNQEKFGRMPQGKSKQEIKERSKNEAEDSVSDDFGSAGTDGKWE